MRIFCDELPPIETKLNTFSEMTGNTHGIKLRIKPPINAKINAVIKEVPSSLESLIPPLETL